LPKIPVHWLSKEARYRIIEILLSTRTSESLAKELDISRSTIRKYMARLTHPSDETMERVFAICKPYEEDAVMKIVIDDLVEAVRKLAESLDKDNHREYLLKRLKEVLNSIEK